MAGFLTLPSELIEIILNELPNPRAHLATLSLLNHACRDLFEGFLYGNVTVRSARQSNELLALFSKDYHKASLVQRLVFERNRPVIGAKVSVDDGALVQRLPNLKVLEVNGWRSRQGIWHSIQRQTCLDGDKRALQKLEELVVTGLARREPIWPRAIMRLPSLKHVSFHMCRLATDEKEPVIVSTTELPALHLLSLSNFDIDPATFRALIGARNVTTIRFEEALRVKYSNDGEYLGSLDGMAAEMLGLQTVRSTHLKHLIHTDSKTWECRELSFSGFGSLTYLEVGARNLYGILSEVPKDAWHERSRLFRNMFPSSLQILCLDIPSSESDWGMFEDFLLGIATDKANVAPNLHAVIWHRKDSAYALESLSDDVRSACWEAVIDVTAAPFSPIYLDSRGVLIVVQDRMKARKGE